MVIRPHTIKAMAARVKKREASELIVFEMMEAPPSMAKKDNTAVDIPANASVFTEVLELIPSNIPANLDVCATEESDEIICFFIDHSFILQYLRDLSQLL